MKCPRYTQPELFKTQGPHNRHRPNLISSTRAGVVVIKYKRSNPTRCQCRSHPASVSVVTILREALSMTFMAHVSVYPGLSLSYVPHKISQRSTKYSGSQHFQDQSKSPHSRTLSTLKSTCNAKSSPFSGERYACDIGTMVWWVQIVKN